MKSPYFRLGVFGINLVIETDNAPWVKGLFDYWYDAKKYSPFKKTWEIKRIRGSIFNRQYYDETRGHTYFELGLGWSFYVMNVFKDYIIKDDYEALNSSIMQPSYRVDTFPELRDYQNEDVLYLLKFKFGLMQNYVGYGKSQVISVLANDFYKQGYRILLVTPNKKARDELVKRIYNLYGIEVSLELGVGHLQAIITSGFLNKKEMKTPKGRKKVAAELEKFDVVMSDEVEYTMNDAGFFIYDHVVNAQFRYGFSGTADKKGAQMITTSKGICNELVAENKDLIKYFGTSLVYRLPEKITVNRIQILTPSMNPGNLRLWELDLDNSGNVYLDIMNGIFTNDEVCKMIVKVIKAYPLMFIPINNLTTIINNWIEKYFIKTFRILLVSHVGYTYYDLKGKKSELTLQEACEMIRKGKVDVIPSTSSGFRALDFPNLQNILIFSGKVAGSFIQQVGRVSRQRVMNVITLAPENGKKIPVYTKGTVERDEMIRSYYKHCDIKEITVKESGLESLNYEN